MKIFIRLNRTSSNRKN